MTDSSVENENIRLWITEGIMYGKYKIENVTREKARDMVASRIDLCQGKAYPFFADVTKVKSIDREARNEFSKGEGIRHMTACALLVNSPVNQVMGNFFMLVNKPGIPTKLFTSSKEALEWLDKFK
jgi:hypothetical protein